MSRYRNVTIWARVQGASGANVVALVPLVTPSATAHWTAAVYYVPDATSVNGLLPEAAGEPFARCRNVTVWPRVTVALGAKVVALVPLVMPSSTAHSTAS